MKSEDGGWGELLPLLQFSKGQGITSSYLWTHYKKQMICARAVSDSSGKASIWQAQYPEFKPK
jgi:hypothetical protein